ncbi:M60 family metallopeptidase [Brachybacterium sp. YJGR34]|uniref:M60 family metallopeptidase n=1 Tax=Brachybacterium sp. YJGR34 TaxID=2059911 RepID=UPI0018E650A1|nr:M60 family metallopeptidase [Brachybacterium sp. YJGR34]
MQTVQAFPRAREVGDTRTYQALSASDLNPSGFYLAPDTALTIAVKEATAEENLLVVGAPDAENDPDQRTPREYPLREGENTVNDPYGGPVYWKVIGEGGQLRARLGQAAQHMPYYLHGRTTEAEFQEQLDARPTPYVEMVSDHALVTLQRSAALRFREEDHVALLDTLEQVIAIEDDIAGLDGSSPLHARLDHRFHLVTRAASIEGIGAYATHGHTLYPEPIQDRLLEVSTLRLNGWGVYHELGHQHQQTPYKPTALTESTVNWYSLAVNREFAIQYGQPPRLHVPESNGQTVWESAIPKVGTPGVDFLESFSVMEHLVMYEQLRLAYGLQFFRDVHRLVREEKPDSGHYGDNDHRLAMLVLYFSKAAQRDLRGYTSAWGIRYGEEFDAMIDALGLPEPEQDLTAIRDEEGAERLAELRG